MNLFTDQEMVSWFHPPNSEIIVQSNLEKAIAKVWLGKYVFLIDLLTLNIWY